MDSYPEASPFVVGDRVKERQHLARTKIVDLIQP